MGSAHDVLRSHSRKGALGEFVRLSSHFVSGLASGLLDVRCAHVSLDVGWCPTIENPHERNCLNKARLWRLEPLPFAFVSVRTG